jgi:hypothetical protein
VEGFGLGGGPVGLVVGGTHFMPAQCMDVGIYASTNAFSIVSFACIHFVSFKHNVLLGM